MSRHTVESVRTVMFRTTYVDGARNTRHAWTGKTYVLVVVEATGGAFGVGEIYCDGHGSPAVAALSLTEEVAPVVVGKDACAIAAIHGALADRFALGGRGDGLGPVISGLDIALWDLLGKIVGAPVRTLLGGHSDRAFVYGSGGMYGPSITPQSLAAEMKSAVALGLGGIKIKAAGAPLAEDVARAVAVRAAIGPEPRFMIDAMFALDVPGAVRLARALAPFDLHFLEAPTPVADRAGWQTVRREGGIALAGPELDPSRDRMRDWLVHDVAHFLQYDLTIAGGLTGGRDLAALARAFHRPVTLHSAASAVGLAASAHLAAAVPNADSVEFHLKHQGLHDWLWRSGWSIEDGHLVIPERPGLGLDITLDDIAALEAT